MMILIILFGDRWNILTRIYLLTTVHDAIDTFE